MAAGNRSTAFHQAVCWTVSLHSPSKQDEERRKKNVRRGVGDTKGEEDGTAGGGGRSGGKRETQEDRCHHCGYGIVGY